MGPAESTRTTVITAGARHWRREELRPARILEDWRRSRGLARRLIARNLRAQYRQTLLGYAWALLPPIASTLLWVFLQSQKIVTVDTAGIPYPVFVITGLLIWGLFIEALSAPLRSVTDSKAMLSKVRFAREALLVAGLGEVLFNFAIRVVPWAGVLIVFGFVPAASWPLAVFGLCALLLLATSIGVLITPLGLLYHDVGRGLAIIGHFWFYLTPIIYPPVESGAGKLLSTLNPVSPLVIATRGWLLGEGAILPWAFAAVFVGSLLLLVLAIALFRVSMPIVIERMSA